MYARRCTKSATNYLSLTGHVGDLLDGARAVSFFCWARVETANGSAFQNLNRLVHLTVGANSPGFTVNLNPGASPPQLHIQCQPTSGDTLRSFVSTLSVSLGAWHAIGAVANIAGDTMRAYVDGSEQSGTSGTWTATSWAQGSPTTSDAIGYTPVSGGSAPADLLADGSYWGSLDGELSALCFWPCDIGSAAFYRLSCGEHPLAVAPAGAILFPLDGAQWHEHEQHHRVLGSLNGSLPVVPGPPKLRPPYQQPALRGRRLTMFDPASGDGAIPVLPPMLLGSGKVA